MKLKLEMENGKTVIINWLDSIEFFEQEIQFAQGNKFLLTDTGKRVSINKIVEWEVVQER